MLNSNLKGYAIALAWPQTLCKQAGAWYDSLMRLIGINKNGYYKVGHSAIILVEPNTGECFYFDFGRYHAPKGFGRIRNKDTDRDLTINTKAVFNNNSISNVSEILAELLPNKSTHGTGEVYGNVTEIDFNKAFGYAVNMQQQGFWQYGPFIMNGTNCSRFVCSTIISGNPSVYEKLLLQFPLTISPTPMWNLMALSNNHLSVNSETELSENTLVTS